MRRFASKAGLLVAIGAAVLALVASGYQGTDGKDVAASRATTSASSPSVPAAPHGTGQGNLSLATNAPSSSTAPPASPKVTTIAPAKPTKLEIPAIGVMAHFGSPISSDRSLAGWSITPPEANMTDLQRVYWWGEQQYSAMPGSPSSGTTFVYGHACTQVYCAFNRLHDLRPGNVIRLTTPKGVLTYTVTKLLKLDKTPQGVGNSRQLYSYGSPNQLRLVTCGYTPDGASPFNWAVLAVLRT